MDFSAVRSNWFNRTDEVVVALMLVENVVINFEKWISDDRINLAKFAVPRYLRVMDDFPKTQTGKLS